jgi:proline iminopeptidase
MRFIGLGIAMFLLLCSGLAICQLPSREADNAAVVKHPPGAYVEVNGAKLWYESEGVGEPLVLIAGGPGAPHNIFHPFFSRLADRHRVIYFDAFGRGKSDRAKSANEYSFDRDVEDLEGLRKALGLRKWAVLGFSYGGMVAQAYALKYPGMVSHLILADTLYSAEMWQASNDNCNYEVQNQFPEIWAKVQQLRSMGLRSSAKEHQKAYDIPVGLLYFHDASLAERLPKETFYIDPDVYYAIAGEDADFLIGGDIAKLDFRARLKDSPMPMLIIAGRYDRGASLPRFAVQFTRYAPQARFVMLEHSGHFTFIEDPDGFFAAVRQFLEQGSSN